MALTPHNQHDCVPRKNTPFYATDHITCIHYSIYLWCLKQTYVLLTPGLPWKLFFPENEQEFISFVSCHG